nr:unnamed protein product [Digitaria exilis]
MADPSLICGVLQPVCGFINQAGVPAATAKGVSSFACIKRNLRDLTKAMEDLQALDKVVRAQVELEANNLNECHPQVSLWLRRVVDVLVDPIVDECDQLFQSSCLCSSALSLGKRYNLGRRIVEMLEYLDRLVKEGNQFETFASKRLPDFVEQRPRTQTFGIEPILRDFRKSFESADMSIIGVWGPGGVGKTTLLNTFNNELKAWGSDHQVVIMIDASNSGTLNRSAIQRIITDRLGLPWNETETEEARARLLEKALRRKKFVILLDDVRNKFQLEDVGIPTPDPENKSKLILTSRYENVCYQMGAHQSTIKMEYLEKEAAWELFRSNLSNHAIAAIDSPDPKNVVREYAHAIVQSCGGLPLALKVIGRAVAGLTEPWEWSLAMQATKDDIKDLEGIPEMLHKLEYSYDKLTSEQQQCFLNLAKLKYINLSHTCIERLPKEFWVLQELVHLDLSVTEALKETFDNCSKLHKLRVLNLFRSNYGVRDVNDLNIGSLKELEFLGITIYAEDVLKKLTKTHPLAKSTQRLSLKHCEQMQSIQISDFTYMVQLGELYIESCLDLKQVIVNSDKRRDDLKQLIAYNDKRKLSCLKFLTLANLPTLQTILVGSSPHYFRNLLEITISHCQKLHNATWVLNLEALEKLSIYHCHELEQVVQETINEVDNKSGSIQQNGIQRCGRKQGFSEEQEIHGMVEDAHNGYVKGCQNMTKSGRISGIVCPWEFPKLRSLVLTGLPKLTMICNPRDFPCLEIIRVECCPRLRALPLDQVYKCPKLKQICGSFDWWERLNWNGKEIMEKKYFIPIQDEG